MLNVSLHFETMKSSGKTRSTS